MRIFPPYRGRRAARAETPDPTLDQKPDQRRWIFCGLGFPLEPMYLDFNVFFDPVRRKALLLRDGSRTEARIAKRLDHWIIGFEKLRIVAGERNASFLDTRDGAGRTGYCQVLPFPRSLQWI